MAIAHFGNAPVVQENVRWGCPSREQLRNTSETRTFPYLETANGVLSEAYAIVQYLAANFNQRLMGNNTWENAQVNQWVQFAQNEITRYNRNLIYPILGFYELNAQEAQRAATDIMQQIQVLDSHLAGRQYIVGNEITLADLEMFFPLRFYMQLVFNQETRSMMPNVVSWFTNMMQNPNIVRAYGRTVLCEKCQINVTFEVQSLVNN